MRGKSIISVPNGFLAAIVMFIFISGIAVMLVSGHKLSSAKTGSAKGNDKIQSSESSGNSLEGINPKAVSPKALEEDSNLPSGYRVVSMLNEEICKGSLVLVNYQHESKIYGENLVNLYENATRSVGVKDDDMLLNDVVVDALNVMFDDYKKAKGSSNILISSAYRSKTDQEEIYAESVKETGKKSTAYYVAVPGFSEHQTGYCFDTAAITSAGEMVELDGEGDSAWLVDNCADYGFILRYPNDKTNITGIGYESWHFRYVGKASSYFIKKNKLCLEEYIIGLSKYTFDNGGLLIDNGTNGKWVVYYVPKLTAFNNTDIPVPVDSEKCPYTVSGDNMDGFIVTVDVSKDPTNAALQKATSEWSFNNSELIIKDFKDYDPENDTEDDLEDSDSDSAGKRSNRDGNWENDSFWDEDNNESSFDVVDNYDEYDSNYSAVTINPDVTFDDDGYDDQYYDDNNDYYDE